MIKYKKTPILLYVSMELIRSYSKEKVQIINIAAKNIFSYCIDRLVEKLIELY